jgi:hypothetical protein
MFPWERRQMDGGSTPLTRFERIYWIAFGGAIVFLVGTNGYRYFKSKQEPEVRPDIPNMYTAMLCPPKHSFVRRSFGRFGAGRS